MSKFNETTKKITETKNHEGATAYTMEPKLELYSAVVTSFVEKKFYEGENETLQRIKNLLPKVDPSFVVKLAIYAREQMYLRTIPLVLTVELAKIHKGDNLVSTAVSRVIQRADEITELLSYYVMANERDENNKPKKLNRLSKQIQKGLALSFNKFSEYQFAKWNRGTNIKLRDALFIVHPKAKSEGQQVVFDKIAKETLDTPDTWEVALSASKDKKASWERLISEDKLGYMALIRNLKNIIQAEVSLESLKIVAKKISNEEAVLNSKQFPFRFLSAYRMIKPIASGKASMILDALEEAILISTKNIKGFSWDESVSLSVDTSGSMSCATLSEKSSINYQDVGLVLGMLLHQKCKDVETSVFGETMEIINLPKKNILSNAEQLEDHSTKVGNATNGHLVIEDLVRRKEIKDKVVMFTDCQLWDSENYFFGENEQKRFRKAWHEYKKIAPQAKLYLFDLAGYGSTPISVQEEEVFLISGFSEKVFDILEAYENRSSAVKEIEKIEL